uniref:Uncharacterized protein n=1 Tax=Myotis myotis TaxID=51298 RepID=A0A7J7U5B7_MYOMY|nr:hypothetical protein mMyoMyo1_008861 [Myotis myotis]
MLPARGPHSKSPGPGEPVVNTVCLLNPPHHLFWFQTLVFLWGQSPPCSPCSCFGSNGPQCSDMKHVTSACTIPYPGHRESFKAGPETQPGPVRRSCKTWLSWHSLYKTLHLLEPSWDSKPYSGSGLAVCLLTSEDLKGFFDPVRFHHVVAV